MIFNRISSAIWLGHELFGRVEDINASYEQLLKYDVLHRFVNQTTFADILCNWVLGWSANL